MASEEYDVVNDHIQHILREAARTIDSVLPEGWGFNLLIFNFGDEGSMFYISNGTRDSMLKAMQEFVRVQKERGH